MSLHLEITQGLRVDDLQALQDKVRLRGGRLIAYSEVISAALISARSYKVKWIASPADKKSAGIGSTIITAILGWWAIAGPYWSITALIWNKRGGYDVTDALLRAHPGNQSLIGHSDAIPFAEFHESASRIALRICAIIAVIAVTALGSLMWYFSTRNSNP
jgi:hypothetical protein